MAKSFVAMAARARPASASTLSGLVLQHLGEDGGGARHIAGGERLFGERQRFLDRRGARRRRRRAGHELLHLAFRHRADEAVDRAAVLEGIDRGDRLDAHLLRQLLVLVDVDLDQAHRAVRVADRLLEHRPELLAGTAPRRPEIDDDRSLVRGVDDVGHEGRGRAVLDELGAAGGVGGAPRIGSMSPSFPLISPPKHGGDRRPDKHSLNRRGACRPIAGERKHATACVAAIAR